MTVWIFIYGTCYRIFVRKELKHKNYKYVYVSYVLLLSLIYLEKRFEEY